MVGIQLQKEEIDHDSQQNRRILSAQQNDEAQMVLEQLASNNTITEEAEDIDNIN